MQQHCVDLVFFCEKYGLVVRTILERRVPTTSRSVSAIPEVLEYGTYKRWNGILEFLHLDKGIPTPQTYSGSPPNLFSLYLPTLLQPTSVPQPSWLILLPPPPIYSTYTSPPKKLFGLFLDREAKQVLNYTGFIESLFGTHAQASSCSKLSNTCMEYPLAEAPSEAV